MADLDKTITEMMEYVCDSLCRYPEMESEEETLAEICKECRLKEFVGAILSQGNDRTNEMER